MKVIIGLIIMIKLCYISEATNWVNITESEKWAQYWSEYYKIEYALIRAIWDQESLRGTSFERYEKHLKKADWYIKGLTETELKDPYSFFSMGDMQVLYGTAKSLGYKGTPHGLKNPEDNYKYGIKFVRQLCITQKTLDKAISAYNQGPVLDSKGKIHLTKFIDENKNGIKDKFEKWKNQGYVNSVLNKYKKYGGLQPVMHLIK